MYDYLNGVVAGKTNTSKGCFVTVEVGGIGYLLELTPRDYAELPEYDEKLKIFTVLIHREDKMSFCGFLHREDRDIFNILTSVSGVGTKMALTLLNEFESSELIGLVIDGSYKALTSAKGVGPKLAQKIILELKDKLVLFKNSEPIEIISSKVKDGQVMEDAQAVLLSLGYEREEIKNAMQKSLPSLGDAPSAEEVLKQTLQVLSLNRT